MKGKSRSSFDELVDAALKSASEWGESVGDGSLPVPLHELAHAKGIRRLRYEPLLSTAGLKRTGNEFEVVVNTEAAGVSAEAIAMSEIGPGWAKLPSPLRFTVAHEIGHVMFYELVGGRTESPLLRKHDEAVEDACSDIARILLLPKKRLLNEVGDGLLSAPHLKELAERFRVSPEVLIRRLGNTDMSEGFSAQQGFLTVVVERQGQLTLRSSRTWGPHAGKRFKLATSEGGTASERTLERLDLGPDVTSRLITADKLNESVLVPCEGRLVLPCRISSVRTYSSPLSIILAITVVDPPMPHS